MKQSWWVGMALICVLPSLSQAECTNQTRVTGNVLNNLVTGNTVCASRNGDRWQEQHHSNGDLWDYKMGPTDRIDPSKKVGTWRIQGNQITYTYTGGQSYTYSIHTITGSPEKYDFCLNPNSGSPSITGATFRIGLVGCQ